MTSNLTLLAAAAAFLSQAGHLDSTRECVSNAEHLIRPAEGQQLCLSST